MVRRLSLCLQITEKDAAILEHLVDIRTAPLGGEDHGFTLSFHFSENPFFTNTVLTKTYKWANEDEVRAQSLSSRTIDWDTHVTWFAEKLASPHSYLYVLEAKGLPVAQARFERRGDSLVLGYSVDYLHRSRGLGTEVVTRAIDALPETGPREILATVKRTNLGSLGALTKAGFRPLYGDLGTDESVQLSRMR